MSPVKKEILNALAAGISSEIASYVFYLEASKKPQAADFKKILQDLAMEEKTHFQILERQHRSLITSEQWISLADVLKGEGLPEINEDMASGHKALINEVQKASSAQTILDIAYRLEEEAHDLFAGEADKASSPEAKKIFGELAKFEAGHMKKVKEMARQYA